MSTAAITMRDIVEFGGGLHRPECVLPTPTGDVYIPDWRGGVAVVRADGSTQSWLAKNVEFDLKPNGIAFLPDGRFLIANLGNDGGVWAMDQAGVLTPFLTHLGDKPLPPANFVYVDEEERVWITVSTTLIPRQNAWREEIRDGLLILVDKHGARVLANNLHYTNEARIDPTGRFIYVVETFGRRLVRFPVMRGGSLGAAELVVQLGQGEVPDGFAFDRAGGIWITSLISNRVLRLHPDGTLETMISEYNEAFVDEFEKAYAAGHMRAAQLGVIPNSRFQHITSIGFGGPDNRICYLGSLHADCLYKFAAPVAGLPQPYWSFPLP